MKNVNRIAFLSLVLCLAITSASFGQLKEDLGTSKELTGPVFKKPEPGNWSNLFNMQMDHSYSMVFSSAGGQFHNVNAYTNTMQFFFSDRMTGRLDLSLLHSPFGSSFLDNGTALGNSGSPGMQFIIRNAELNYHLSDNSSIRLQFQQIPSYELGYGLYSGPFGYRNYGRIYDLP